jgi:hypothetical protein
METEVISKPMRQLSLILPKDAEEIHELIFTHLSDTIEGGMIIYMFDSLIIRRYEYR